MIPKLAFRKYFTSMLRGRLVSEGVSTLPEPHKALFVGDPFVRQLNNRIRPRIFSFRKEVFDPKDVESIRRQAVQGQYGVEPQKPYAATRRGVMIQYRKPGEEE